LISTNSRIVDARQEAFYVTKGDINKKLVFATYGATPIASGGQLVFLASAAKAKLIS